MSRVNDDMVGSLRAESTCRALPFEATLQDTGYRIAHETPVAQHLLFPERHV